MDNNPESGSEEMAAEAPFAMVDTIKQSYARNKTITYKGGKARGCWSDTFSGACEATKYSTIQESAIVQNQDAGQCDDGSDVTVVTYN